MKKNRDTAEKLLGLLLLFLAIFVLAASYRHESSALQLHDSYLLLSPANSLLLFLGPACFLTFLPLSLYRKFTSVYANLGLLAGLIGLWLLLYLLQGILQEMHQDILQDEELPISFKEAMRQSMQERLYWINGILAGLLLISTSLAGYMLRQIARKKAGAGRP